MGKNNMLEPHETQQIDHSSWKFLFFVNINYIY